MYGLFCNCSIGGHFILKIAKMRNNLLNTSKSDLSSFRNENILNATAGYGTKEF